ncbi:MAG: lipopolysaccharide biosynthesis protein [Planctomycetota bacterium]
MSPDRHFNTEHLQGDLKGRSIRGGAVTLTGQGFRFALQTGSIIVLARMLTPGDFGLIAMITAITGFIASFKDAGLSMATVQREKIDHDQVSTLFWINVMLSTAMMLLIAVLAPVLAWLYGEPRLVLLTLGLAGSFIFAGLAVQHQALLRRQLRFRALVAIDIVSRALGIAVAIVAAAWGAGCWALVLMAAVTAVVNAVGVWVVCDWRPGLPRRGCGVRSMLAFGGNLTVSHVVNNGARNLDNVLIGSVWGASMLGAYSKAYQLLLLPFQQFASPVTAVALPVLSRLQSDHARFRRYFRGGIMLLAALGMPLVAFAFVTAHDLTLLVLGDQWAAAAPIFMALAPAAFVETFNVANGWAFIPLGRTDRYLRCVVASSVVIMVAFAIGLPWGAIGVACAYSAARVALRLPQALYAFHGTPLTIGDLGAALWRPAAASLLAATGLWIATMSASWPVTSGARIAMGLLVYAAIYGPLLVLLPGGRDCFSQIASIRHALLGRPAPVTAS